MISSPPKTQRDFLKELADLVERNPEMEVRFCVGTEELDDRYSWMSQTISEIEVRPWYEAGDGCIVTDAGEIVDLIGEEAFGRAKSVICVFTHFATPLQNQPQIK